MRGPVTSTIRSPGTRFSAKGKASTVLRSSEVPTPEPPTVTMQTCSSGA